MGRDRDPFDRALTALRRRVIEAGPLQGAPLPVNTLAEELGVSTTPVREALAWLAGEGLIARTAAGYAAQVHDRQSLSRLYALAGILAEAALAQPDAPPIRDAEPIVAAPGPADDPLAALSGEPASVLDALLARVQAQLAPFRAAEEAVLGCDDRIAIARAVNLAGAKGSERGGGPLAARVRRYYRRRVRRAGDILAKALGLT